MSCSNRKLSAKPTIIVSSIGSSPRGPVAALLKRVAVKTILDFKKWLANRGHRESTAGHVNNAVIIPHYNDTARLRRCLSALTREGTGGADILVVDNGSTEPLEALKRDFPSVRFVYESGKGAALARNRGVQETRAGTLAFLDADCVPAPGWLGTIAAVAGRSDIVGGAIDVFDETPAPRTGAQAFETVFAFNYRNYIEKKGFSVTANLVTSRDVFETVGPFINGVSEDEEWCRRARSKGFAVALAEELRVAHPTRSDWPALEKKWKRLTQEMHALHRNTYPGPAGQLRWLIRAVLMPFSAIVHLPKVLFSPKLKGAGERLRGAATLVRLRLLRARWMVQQAAGGRI